MTETYPYSIPALAEVYMVPLPYSFQMTKKRFVASQKPVELQKKEGIN